VAAGGALVASIGTGGDSVTLAGFNPTDPLNSMPLQQFQFANGTSLSFEQLLNQVAASSGEVINPDGSISYYHFSPGQDQVYEGQTYAAGSGAGQQFLVNADGTIREYTLDGQGRPQSTEATFTDGSIVDSTYSYNADGSYTQIEVNTDGGAGGTTTAVMHFDSAGDLIEQDVTNPNGSTESDTFDTQGRTVIRDITQSDGSTADSTYLYNADGTFKQTEVDAPAGGPITTQVTDYDSGGNQVSQNSYTPNGGGSYTDSWEKSDGSAGGYWWNASTLEYQAHWSNSDGSYSTDDYQYTAGGAPGGSVVSFTETYSDSSGDQGTRQYSATTGVTSLSWYSSATGTLTGTTSDSGFIGLQNDGELTNTQHDPSFFNPAVSPAFQSFLAGH
jgi:hypothetical protein